MAALTFDGDRAALAALLARLPGILSGRDPDPTGGQVAAGFALRLGQAALTGVQLDFLRKSAGGVGLDGIKWDPLKRETVARRRTGPGELKKLGVAGKRTRGLLTAAQDLKWRGIYKSTLMRLRLHVGEGEARAQAARTAWAILKREGAQTKLQVLGGRQVPIGRDTDRLFRSLSPGVAAGPDQVMEAVPGKVAVGSNVEYFERFHKRRPVWPTDGAGGGVLADAHWPRVREAGLTGLLRAVELLIPYHRG